MDKMARRAFLGRAAVGAGAVAGVISTEAAGAESKGAFRADDRVKLGRTGIEMSRLGIGTGTFGGREQRDLGIDGLADLFVYGFDRGVTYWDLADMYKTHPHAKAAMKRVPREKLTILTKTRAKTADDVRKDLDRFRLELGVDQLDICLLHCMQDDDWTTKMSGPMEVLAEAKEKQIIRAKGCSCHTLGALKAAAASDWVDVDLARINPRGAKMDDEPEKVVAVLREMRVKGKGILGMKILGEGTISDERRASLRFVLGQGLVDAFNIGFSRPEQIDDIVKLMPKAVLQG